MLRNLANKIFGDFTLVFGRGEEYSKNRLYILRFSIYANVIAILYGGYFFTGMLIRQTVDTSLDINTFLSTPENPPGNHAGFT